VPYLSASEVVIHYEEALYQVYVPLPFTFTMAHSHQGHQRWQHWWRFTCHAVHVSGHC